MLRNACVGALVAVLGAVAVTLLGVGWAGPEPMVRERLFALTLDALACGWIAAVLVRLLSRHGRGPGGASATAAVALGLLLAPLGWFALGFGLALVALALARPLPAAPRALAPLGLAAHAAPFLALLVAPERSPLPFLEEPGAVPPAPANRPTLEVGPGSPDVLLVVVDTLRADALLDPEVPTPNLDRLRERGLWGDFAVAPCNQTLPSHMSLLLGVAVEKTGMRSNDSRWPTADFLRREWGAKPLAERFAERGWRTVGVGANPLLTLAPDPERDEQDFASAFDAWFGMQRQEPFKVFLEWVQQHTLVGLLTPRPLFNFPLSHVLYPHPLRLGRVHTGEGTRTTDVVVHYLDQLEADSRPWFVFVNYFDPHTPYLAPAPFAGTIARPEEVPPGFPPLPAGEFAMREELRRLLAEGAPEAEWRPIADFLHDLYREEVAYLDAQLGRLLERVEASGRPTLVLVVSDHGEAFGEHRNLEHRHTLYEEELRIPFVLAGPGVPAAGRLAVPPSLPDAARTLADLCGVPSVGMDGSSVLDRPTGDREVSFMIGHVAVREGNWKMICRLDYGEVEDPMSSDLVAGAYVLEPLSLFDLAADPGEREDRLADEPERVARLQAILEKRLERDSMPLLPPRRLTARQQQDLAAAGYADQGPAEGAGRDGGGDRP